MSRCSAVEFESDLNASTDAEAELDVRQLVADVLDVSADLVVDDLSYQSIPQWDSLRHVALVLALEEALDVDIDADEMLELSNVSAIRDFVERRLPMVVAEEPAATSAPKPTIHRGLVGVRVDRSRITRIDGERGELSHRGYSIDDLVEQSTFEETSWLLVHGELPDRNQLAEYQTTLRESRAIPDAVVDILRALRHAHPMEALRTAISALGGLDPDAGDTSASALRARALRLIAQTPTVIATHHALRSGHQPMAPNPQLSHAANFLSMLQGGALPAPLPTRILDRDLILHADHSSNASAFTARVVIGCRSSLHAAVTAAVGAFAGELHGGAAEGVLELVDAVKTPERAAAVVRERQAENRPIIGFGHRVYRTEDPRARHLQQSALQLSQMRGSTLEYDVLQAVVAAMEPYARHGVGPNVDLYAGLVYRLLGLPDDLAVPVFVAGRMAGWVAQAIEQHENNVLIRPLLEYDGPAARPYRAIERR